jgi:hypothetical protein
MRQPLNIGRAASYLMRRYGEESTNIALQRSRYCAIRNDETTAAEWRLVVLKIGELHHARHEGPLH